MAGGALRKLTTLRPWLVLLALMLAACDAAEPAAQPPIPTRPIPTLFPTSVIAAPAPAIAAPTQPADTGWLPGGAGVELRRIRVPGADGRPAFPVVVVRL